MKSESGFSLAIASQPFENSLKIWKLTQNLKTHSNFENSLKFLLSWWSRFKRISIRQNQAWQKRKQNTDKSITIKDTNKGRITVNKKKMPKIDTLDALEEREEHEDDYQTNSNW